MLLSLQLMSTLSRIHFAVVVPGVVQLDKQSTIDQAAQRFLGDRKNPAGGHAGLISSLWRKAARVTGSLLEPSELPCNDLDVTVLLRYVSEFPDSEEMRTLCLLDPKTNTEKMRIHIDEQYCADLDCNCQRVMLYAYDQELEQLAVIGYGFHDDAASMPGGKNPYLEPLAEQSDSAEMVLDYISQMIQSDEAYRRRLVRHYEEIKNAVSNPSHPTRRAVLADRAGMRRLAQGLVRANLDLPRGPSLDRRERNRKKRLRKRK